VDSGLDESAPKVAVDHDQWSSGKSSGKGSYAGVRGEVFVLVGVAGFEPVAFAV
jgi:hypothetical protein